MLIGQALDLVSRYDSLRNPLTSLGDYLDPELISRCLAESGTVTLRKRRLPLEMMVWWALLQIVGGDKLIIPFC